MPLKASLISYRSAWVHVCLAFCCVPADALVLPQKSVDGRDLSSLQGRGACDRQTDWTWSRIRESAQQPCFDEHAMWEWTPSRHQDAKCALTRTTTASFCKAMDLHGFERVMLFGDSITNQFYHELLILLGTEHGKCSHTERLSEERQHTSLSNEEYEFEGLSCNRNTTIACNNRNISIDYYCSDELLSSGGRKGFQYYEESLFWPEYESVDIPTLLVYNTGAHFGNLGGFQGAVDKFFTRLATESKPRDKHVYRLSVPGHDACSNFTRPLHSSADFRLDGEKAKRYNWNLTLSFNDYVREVVTRPQVAEKINVTILDVYLMSILRPDGHISSSDCLHWSNYGVVQWWWHSLITELL